MSHVESSHRLNESNSSGASRSRTPWGTLSRERIVEAATAMVVDGHYEQLTIRRLATSLGVAPMTIYGHVRDRNDILDEVTERLLAESWQPQCAPGDWRSWIVEAATRLRELLVDYPPALHVYLNHPVTTPGAIVRMEAMVSVLRANGCGEQSALKAYAAIHTYTIGFASLESSRAKSAARENSVDKVVGLLATFTTTDQFIEGLNLIVEGIESKMTV